MSSENSQFNNNKSIIPSLLKGTLGVLVAHPIWAILTAYLYKKEYALRFLPSAKLNRYISEKNIQTAVLGLLAAFKWGIMPSLTIISRVDFGGYNMFLPRDSQKKLTGSFARLQGIYDNSIETYASIVAAVLISQINNVPQKIRVNLSLLYLLTRTTWLIGYLTNIPPIRGISFNLANWSMFYLFAFSSVNNFEDYFNILTNLI